MKGAMTVILLAFLVASILYVAIGERRDSNGAATDQEPRQACPEDAVAVLQSRALGLVRRYRWLMPEGEVLGGQGGLSSKQRSEVEDQMYRIPAWLPNPLP